MSLLMLVGRGRRPRSSADGVFREFVLHATDQTGESYVLLDEDAAFEVILEWDDDFKAEEGKLTYLP
eukprot:gene10435-7419_t